jgi:hypothetical protein
MADSHPTNPTSAPFFYMNAERFMAVMPFIGVELTRHYLTCIHIRPGPGGCGVLALATDGTVASAAYDPDGYTDGEVQVSATPKIMSLGKGVEHGKESHPKRVVLRGKQLHLAVMGRYLEPEIVRAYREGWNGVRDLGSMAVEVETAHPVAWQRIWTKEEYILPGFPCISLANLARFKSVVTCDRQPKQPEHPICLMPSERDGKPTPTGPIRVTIPGVEWFSGLIMPVNLKTEIRKDDWFMENWIQTVVAETNEAPT